MADLNTTVDNFLRDAQYRVATLSIEMYGMKRRRKQYDALHDLRAQIILWMDMLYESRDNIYGNDYNYLGGWTDRQIIEECEYLRKIGGMSTIGYITFAGYSPVVRSVVTGVPNAIPAGTENQYLRFNSAGDLVAEDFPDIGGMISETISEYFS